MHNTSVSFSFGQNWQDFVASYLSPERVQIAKQHLIEFLDMADLHHKIFLDVGCGSGLSSLAAYELGAEQILSFDVDPRSVSATQRVKASIGNPAHWTVLRGSILDRSFIETLPRADIVYSWGVLHHTGQMWHAIEHTASLLKPEGLLYLALYTTTRHSARWLRVKQRYNQASSFEKRLMELLFITAQLSKRLLVRFENPIKHVREYQRRRGMAYLTDVRDWLGGYPYEYAKIEEVLSFARKQLALNLINIRTGHENTEYLLTPM